MRKIATMIAAVCMSLCLLCACSSAGEPAPLPQYPLDAGTIEKCVGEWGVSGTVQEDEQVREKQPDQSMYEIVSAGNGKLVAGVSSGQKDGARMLVVSFPPFYHDNAVPAEQSEAALAFASCLFGGFESTHQVYDSFIKEYGTVNTEKEQFKIPTLSRTPQFFREMEATWTGEVGGVDCEIQMEQPRLDDPQEYIRSIAFYTDRDAFLDASDSQG